MIGRLVTTRLADLAIVLFSVSVIVFGMIRFIPGDAVAIMLGANTEVTPERIAEMRGRARTRPADRRQQYAQWAGKALRGDFGTSLWTGRPVIEEIGGHVWPTLQLTILALVIGAVLAVPAGVFMARLRGKAADGMMRVVTVAGLTIPSFWLGIVMILASRRSRRNSRRWATCRSAGSARQYRPPAAARLRARPAHPRQPLAARPLRDAGRAGAGLHPHGAGQGRQRAQGALQARAAQRAIPFVTSVGIMTGYLLGGAIVVEQVFAIPGLGRLILGAIAERNYPLLQATILVVTFGFVFVNFAVDLLYLVIDPRVRA